MKSIINVVVAALFCAAAVAAHADPNADLCGAAGMGSIDEMKAALKAGANINYRDPKNQGRTPLMLSLVFGSTDKVRFLVASKADVNIKSDDGMNALMYAIDNGNVEIITILIKARADVNAKDNDGMTPLMRVTRMNAFEKEPFLVVARALLDAKAEVNAADNNGDTALMHAVRTGNGDLAGLLIGRGGNINVKNKNGRTALMDAKLNEDAETVALLKNAGADDLPNRDDELYFAVKNNDCAAAKVALAAGAHLNSPIHLYLHRACANGSAEMVKLLIDSKIDVNTAGYSGETALTAALSAKNTEILKLLTAAGANANTRDEKGNTPLILTAQNMSEPDLYVEIAVILLKAGARVNEKGDKGMTALMWASGQGLPAVVKCLLAAGADAGLKNGSGMTALMFAANFGQMDSAQYLIKAGAKVNDTDNDGWSALFHGIKGAFDPAMPAYLVSCGANVNLKAKGGWTPLMEAASKGKPEIVQYLIKAGADVNARSDEGRTAAGYASFMVIDDPESPFRAIVNMLKKAGAK
jgi:ankyrin repeat protein